MELTKATACIFTGLPVKNLSHNKELIEYYVTTGKKEHLIRLDPNLSWFREKFFKRNKHVFVSLLYLDKWFKDEQIPITIDTLKQLLAEQTPPRLPQQKFDNLFLLLNKSQKTDGAVLQVGKLFFEKENWKYFYFKSADECNFYFRTLHEEGLINGKFKADNLGRIIYMNITFKGLAYARKLQQQGEKSKKCFIAMSFDDSTKTIRQAIKDALVETGFEPVLVDEKDIDSGQTINDAIIANLKMCKFCIADFTRQSKGVYFESGFALGQNKKVIYTCQKDDFESAHFDIKPLQHIIYETPEQLKVDLINKIIAWIK